jgi:hypothetical protein
MDPFWEIILFILATIRVILEFSKIDLTSLPLAKKISQNGYDQRIREFHRLGFFMGLGYIILTLLQWFLKII